MSSIVIMTTARMRQHRRQLYCVPHPCFGRLCTSHHEREYGHIVPCRPTCDHPLKGLSGPALSTPILMLCPPAPLDDGWGAERASVWRSVWKRSESETGQVLLWSKSNGQRLHLMKKRRPGGLCLHVLLKLCYLWFWRRNEADSQIAVHILRS